MYMRTTRANLMQVRATVTRAFHVHGIVGIIVAIVSILAYSHAMASASSCSPVV